MWLCAIYRLFREATRNATSVRQPNTPVRFGAERHRRVIGRPVLIYRPERSAASASVIHSPAIFSHFSLNGWVVAFAAFIPTFFGLRTIVRGPILISRHAPLAVNRADTPSSSRRSARCSFICASLRSPTRRRCSTLLSSARQPGSGSPSSICARRDVTDVRAFAMRV
jgi:hypothetical protein